jgi:hypothetical protein
MKRHLYQISKTALQLTLHQMHHLSINMLKK